METKTKMSQRDIILWHLQNVGTLTRAQAMSEYGIVELPARIVELKRLGHKITSEKGTSKNRFGTVHFNIYKLEEKDEPVGKIRETVPKLNPGPCFHGEIWYSCPHCGKGIEAHGIEDTKDGIHKCYYCGGEYYYRRFER